MSQTVTKLDIEKKYRNREGIYRIFPFTNRQPFHTK